VFVINIIYKSYLTELCKLTSILANAYDKSQCQQCYHYRQFCIKKYRLS